MNAQSVAAVVIASITFYVGLYHLLIYSRRKQHREDLTFALMCLATGFYAVFCSGLYNAVSVAEGAQWQRLQFIALAFLTTAFLWFAADYTGQKTGIVTYAFSAYYLLAIIVQSVDRSALTWLVDQPAIKTVTLPLLSYQIIYYEATLGLFTAVQGLVGLAASTYILWTSVRFYRRGYRRESIPLLMALGCMYAAALNDTLVSQGAYQFIYAIEYGYLAMILLMAYSLSNAVVEAAMAKESLRESEARWQFALEGSGDGVWDWNAQTNQVYFSRQWKAMLGFAEHEIGDTLAEWDMRIHPDDRDYAYGEIRKHLEGETPFYISEHRLQCKDGTYKWILDRGQVIEWTKDGKPLRVIGTHSDITRRRQAEAALRESEENFRSIVENALVGIFMVDDAYRFVYVNDELGRILQYSSEELVGMDFRYVLSDESRTFVADYYIRRQRGEQLPSRYELSVTRQDGQVRYAEMSVTVVRDAAGRLRTIGQFVDITERKQAEMARQESEQRFRTVIQNAQAVIFILDRDGVFLLSEGQALAKLGLAPGQVVGLPARQVYGHNPSVLDGIAKSLAGELTHFTSVEQGFVFDTVCSPYYGLEGELTGMIGIAIDITERKRAEEALRGSEERYRRFVEVSPIPMWINKDGIINYMNPAALRVLGATCLEQVVGKAALDFIHPDYHEIVKKRISQMIDEEKIASLLEEKYVRLDGRVIDVEVIATPFTTPDGRAMQVLFQDVTRRKQTEAEREALIADLEAKNAELERFTYTVSHDLKSPLITIAGFVGFLQEDALAGNLEQVRRDASYINDAVSKMQRLLSELLELSRIGRMMNPSEEVLFADIVHEAVELVRGRIEARGVQVQIAPGLPAVYGDRARLVEVVQNLVDNACKFMGEQPHPRIEIGARQDEAESIFYVRDNGIGIEPPYQDKVFGLFEKLDPTSDGTGIGLALVRRIVETHGGKIWVESPGQDGGATFYFTLPVITPDAQGAIPV